MSKLNSYTISRYFYKMLNHSKEQWSSFSSRENNGKHVAMKKQSPAVETKAASVFLCVPLNSYSVTAAKTLPFLCTVMCFFLKDFSLTLLGLLLLLEMWTNILAGPVVTGQGVIVSN